MKHALILSGGGARGAYEAGVLAYVAENFENQATPGGIFGTSVGAVNGAFAAAYADDPRLGSERLTHLWSTLRLEQVLGFGLRQVIGLRRLVFGGGAEPTSLLDVSPLISLVTNAIPWRNLSKNLERGVLDVLCLAATELSSGMPTLFVDRGKGVLSWPSGVRQDLRLESTSIGPRHVLASAAIPLVFPPIRVGANFYCDGGLRLNTPMSPAIRFGYDRLLVIGVSASRPTPSPVNQMPGLSFTLGKVLNAFLLDHINTDLAASERTNSLLERGERAFGSDFVERINEGASIVQRPVKTLAIQPSVDLGVIAADHLQAGKVRFGKALGRRLMRFLDVGSTGDADLASYLLFDGDYATHLLELGRRDAAKKHDALADFFTEAE